MGAVVVDLEGNVAAAVSSGGLAMKHPGRVGQVSQAFLCHVFICLLTLNIQSFLIMMNIYLTQVKIESGVFFFHKVFEYFNI